MKRKSYYVDKVIFFIFKLKLRQLKSMRLEQ